VTSDSPPSVSVILPVYNGARYVAAAIESVFAQTYRDWELLIVDDGSADGTPAVLARYADRPGVTLIRQENTGLAGARNAGIRQARGDLLGLLDADDEWLPGFLAAFVALAAQRPEAVVFYGSARCMDAEGRDLPQVAAIPPAASSDLYATLLRANFLNSSAVVARRAAVVEAGLFDASLRSCEDWDLWLRLSRTQSFAYVPGSLVRFRLHGGSLSTDVGGMERAADAVIAKHFGPPQGDPAGWPPEKRQAYGGLYRHHTLLHLLRRGDWEACARHLRRALCADPALAQDPDLFFELALGTQPVGYRGTAHQLDLPRNAAHVQALLRQVFHSPAGPELTGARRAAFGAAWFALGLAAYNTGQLALARRYLFRAVRATPALWHEKRLVLPLLKSLLGRAVLEAARGLSRRRSSRPDGAGQS
jgi:glycosyltransferase involved in cell wall biosynthesis